VRECTLFSADQRTRQLVATAGAALGLAISREVELPRIFPEQGLLLIATDLLPISIPGRSGVLLLDLETAVGASSGALVGMAGSDREVVRQLAGRLGILIGDQSPGRLISIVSANGGLGLTTLVALLGLVLGATNQRTVLIDRSEQLHRVIGSKAFVVDHELQTAPPNKVGVLNSDVFVTPALLFDLRARFDAVIVGAGELATKLEPPTDLLLLTANTALSVEKGALVLANANYESVQVILRRPTYGSLSTHQVAAALRASIVEWPTDPKLALAADFGDLSQAKAALKWANQTWLNLIGTRRAD
jgi:hypothetical protein